MSPSLLLSRSCVIERPVVWSRHLGPFSLPFLRGPEGKRHSLDPTRERLHSSPPTLQLRSYWWVPGLVLIPNVGPLLPVRFILVNPLRETRESFEGR